MIIICPLIIKQLKINSLIFALEKELYKRETGEMIKLVWNAYNFVTVSHSEFIIHLHLPDCQYVPLKSYNKIVMENKILIKWEWSLKLSTYLYWDSSVQVYWSNGINYGIHDVIFLVRCYFPARRLARVSVWTASDLVSKQ